MADKFPSAPLRKIYVTRERDGWRARWCRPGPDGHHEFPDHFAVDEEGLYELLALAIADIERVVGESKGKESR